MEELAKFGIGLVDKFFDYSDRLDNAITMTTVGDTPDWLNTEIKGTNQTLFSAIGYVATCKSLMKVAIDDAVGGGADKGEVLNLIRDVSSKVTTYWADAFTSVGSGTLSVGMGGVLIIDKMLTAFAEEAASTKLEDIAYVYHHYNEGFSGFGHKPMTAKDWRAKAIEVIDKHPDDPEIAVTALEAGFREYASEFFALTQDQQAEVAADTPLVTVKNIPYISEADQEKLTEEYIAHLKADVMPGVLKSVEKYMITKVEQQQLQTINKIKDYYNSKIKITITENVAEGEESAYVGYKFRFAPLSDTANVGNWTGKWGGEPVNTSATLMGFMTAGLPHTIEFFAPDADMNTSEPEFVVPFVISIPEISIEFGNTLSAKDICGTYRLQGVYVEKDDGIISEENVSFTLTVSQEDGDNMKFQFIDNEPQLPEMSYTQQKPRTDNCNKCSKINTFTTFYTCNSDKKEIQYKSKVTLKINELRGTKLCISTVL